tara:strand:+ start:816 stop:950 length:135 start_codon:yes stop_codon:yes gene_type:complete
LKVIFEKIKEVLENRKENFYLPSDSLAKLINLVSIEEEGQYACC